MKFRSITYGQLDLTEIPEKLLTFYNERKQFGGPFYLVLGTDSHSRHDTKIVTVIAIVCEGHGGIFFYTDKHIPRVTNLAEKLQIETGESLLIATRLLEELEKPEYEEVLNEIPITIHIDAGTSPKCKTAGLVDGLVGWVKATGLQCEIKPDSFVASSIADKWSK